MTTPLDIIAAAMHAAECGCGTAGVVSQDQAAIAVNTLADERIVAIGARALFKAGWALDGDSEDTKAMARVVLLSVAEEA